MTRKANLGQYDTPEAYEAWRAFESRCKYPTRALADAIVRVFMLGSADIEDAMEQWDDLSVAKAGALVRTNERRRWTIAISESVRRNLRRAIGDRSASGFARFAIDCCSEMTNEQLDRMVRTHSTYKRSKMPRRTNGETFHVRSSRNPVLSRPGSRRLVSVGGGVRRDGIDAPGGHGDAGPDQGRLRFDSGAGGRPGEDARRHSERPDRYSVAEPCERIDGGADRADRLVALACITVTLVGGAVAFAGLLRWLA